MTHEYMITGMTCMSCVARIKDQLLRLGDVTAVDVQLNPSRAIISMNKHIPVLVLQQAVSKAGLYKIIEMTGPPVTTNVASTEVNESGVSYLPIILIFAYIVGVSLLVQISGDSFNVELWMRHFMAGFFLVFSFFKIINLQGFATGYRNYDIVAKKIPVWGFIYPFLELALGIAYLISFEPLGTNIAAFIIMGVGCIGVIQSLLKKTAFECACLGTVIRVPLGKVSLLEDVIMIAMSGIMITTLI
jgi:copper chaperone CopZ